MLAHPWKSDCNPLGMFYSESKTTTTKYKEIPKPIHPKIHLLQSMGEIVLCSNLSTGGIEAGIGE